MLMAFTSLPGFVPLVFRGMPTVWRGRHRLIFCWLVFMQAVHPGRHTLEEMARWTPATITAWQQFPEAVETRSLPCLFAHHYAKLKPHPTRLSSFPIGGFDGNRGAQRT